jgi:hypothetical protein
MKTIIVDLEDETTVHIDVNDKLTSKEIAEVLNKKFGIDGWISYMFK